MSYSPSSAAGLRSVVSKTTAYTAVAGDAIMANATSAPFTITLPAASVTAVVDVKKTDSSANAVTISPASGTIDGASTVVISQQYVSYTVRSDGTNWFAV